MSGFNYSKWDKIELSDDESDCHPNIDKESWFRMKHRSRLEREEREDAEIKSMEQLNAQNQARLNVIRARLGVNQSGQQQSEDAEFEDLEALEGEAAELETEVRKRNKRIGEIKERRAWNIDNICKVVEEKTVVNTANKANSLKAEDFEPTGHTEAVLAEKSGADASNSADPSSSSSPTTTTTATTASATSKAAPAVQPTSAAVKSTATSTSTATPVGPAASPAVAGREKFAVMSYNDFVIKHETILETYSEIRSLEDSKDYLFRHCDILLHEHSQSYMLLSCLEDEMNGKHARMKLVCRQSQILSHITELAASLGRDPRDVVLPFFRRIEDREYLSGFEKAVSDFTERIEQRAVEKRREMDAEARRESRDEARRAYQQRKEEGLVPEDKPDPFEVLESLPTELRDAFEMQDLEQLQLVLSRMSPADAKKYMKLCVDSGLWVPSHESNLFEDEGEEEGEAEN